MKIDVVIPVYKPDGQFLELIRRIKAQTAAPSKIILMNTEKALWDGWFSGLSEKEKKLVTDGVLLSHVTKDEFDHGGTRDEGLRKGDGDAVVFMTDDALPADRHLLERLTAALFSRDDIAAAYARQLPSEDCRAIERYTRSFNYPKESRIKTIADKEELGIKTYFCSNVCAAYRRDRYLKAGGFIKKTIFNEDMIFAAKLMEHGYAVCYVAEAKVIHSHNYSCMEQFRRNFDLAVSQADHPEVFSGLKSEGEVIRLVKQTAVWLVKNGKLCMVPYLAVNSGFKYMGYLAGKRYRSFPRRLILLFTMNKNYWKGYKGSNV